MWTFYNSSGEAMIIDGGVQNPMDANLDISSLLIVGNGGSTGIAISANGEVTMAAQPCVLAFNSATDSNVTGNGATPTIDFNTEVFDQNADFASDTFTAPVAGRYLISSSVYISGMTTAQTNVRMLVIASNRTFTMRMHDTANQFGASGWVFGTALVDMDASCLLYTSDAADE